MSSLMPLEASTRGHGWKGPQSMHGPARKRYAAIQNGHDQAGRVGMGLWDSDRVVAPWCSRLPNITDVVAGSLPAHVNSPAKHELVPHVYVCK